MGDRTTGWGEACEIILDNAYLFTLEHGDAVIAGRAGPAYVCAAMVRGASYAELISGLRRQLEALENDKDLVASLGGGDDAGG